MKIDFSKLGVLLLPTFIRHTKMAYFIEACIQPVKTIYNDLVAWNEEKKLEIATTCQAMYLEAYLNYNLLGTFERTIVIKDGDGVIVDFYVVIPKKNSIDIDKLDAIMDKYKLLGKRYMIAGGTITITAVWDHFIREIETVTDVAQWTNFLPEISGGWKKTVYLNIDVSSSNNRLNITPYVTDGDDNGVIISSTINGSATVYYTVDDNGNEITDNTTVTFSVMAGSSSSAPGWVMANNIEDPTGGSKITAVNPASDDNYIYKKGSVTT